MKLSWLQRGRRIYPFILILVLLVHTLVLVQRFKKAVPDKITDNHDRPLQVRLLDEKKQIVQSEDPDKKRIFPDSSYLSDKDRHFDRETMARKIAIFKKAARGGSETQQKKKKINDVKLSDLSAAHGNVDPFKDAAKEYAKQKQGIKNGAPDSDASVSSTNDYVEKVPLGDLTALNTSEYKYYGYYHRIRQKLEQFWGRSIQEKADLLVKGGRRIASSEEFVTSVQVTMNTLGKIIGIKIKGSSGVKELDDAAVESFNEAGPFPNPPKGLIENGRVTVEWGFVVKS